MRIRDWSSDVCSSDLDAFEDIDGVDVVSRQQWAGAKLDGESVNLSGNDAGFDDIYDLDMVEGREAIAGAEAIVSDDFADEHDLAAGDTLDLSFQAGKSLQLEVVGIQDRKSVV